MGSVPRPHREGRFHMAGVSYVVTVYNKAPYLPAMLDALAGQAGDFERQFIFVDDGSTDGSLDILRPGRPAGATPRSCPRPTPDPVSPPTPASPRPGCRS